MRLPVDDDVYELDQDYLGPPGRYLGRLKYRSLALFPLIFVCLMLMQRGLGLGLSLLSFGYLVVATAWTTRWLSRLANFERPLTVVLQIFCHELGAQRPPSRGDAASFSSFHFQQRITAHVASSSR